MFCDKCNRELPDNAAFCGYCGNAVVTGESQETDTIIPDTVTIEESTDAVFADFVPNDDASIQEHDVQMDDDVVTVFEPTSKQEEPKVEEVRPQEPIQPRQEITERNEYASYSHNRHGARETFEQDDRCKVVKTSTYFWMMLAMMVPGVNLVMLLIWSFSEKINQNRRNFSRAALIWLGIGIVFSIISLIIFIISFMSYSAFMSNPLLLFEYR